MKNNALAVLLILLACSVIGAGSPASAVKPKLGPAARALMAAQKNIANLTADFHLTVAGAGPAGKDMEAEGKLWLEPGRRYRVEYSRPEVQVLVSNGQRRWLYMKKINQVQIQTLPPAGNPAELFLELGGGLPALIQRCQVKRLPDETGAKKLQVFELTPLPGEALEFSRARLWLDARHGIPQRVQVDAARQVQAQFSNVTVRTQAQVQKDPALALPADTFIFTTPKDAEVIEPLWQGN